MEDYRDLVTVSLALVCAGVMLVAGQLYLEHGTINPLRNQLDLPQTLGTTPPMISRAPSPEEKATEHRRHG